MVSELSNLGLFVFSHSSTLIHAPLHSLFSIFLLHFASTPPSPCFDYSPTTLHAHTTNSPHLPLPHSRSHCSSSLTLTLLYIHARTILRSLFALRSLYTHAAPHHSRSRCSMLLPITSSPLCASCTQLSSVLYHRPPPLLVSLSTISSQEQL